MSPSAWVKANSSVVLAAVAVVGLAVGGALYWPGYPELAALVWAAGTVPVLIALLVQIVVSLRKAASTMLGPSGSERLLRSLAATAARSTPHLWQLRPMPRRAGPCAAA
jgi:hypothetical protein